jgi:hypothetical protein
MTNYFLIFNYVFLSTCYAANLVAVRNPGHA